MPEALATTKRKFYKALDALTNSSQPSVVPAYNPSTSLSEIQSIASRKRTPAEAYDEARDRVRKRLRSSASDSLRSVRDGNAYIAAPERPLKLTASNTKGKDDSQKESLPNFSPWSQEMFLARLKTFSSVSRWHPKPDLINEVVWAKRGWSCIDVNTVACKGGCERRVLVRIDSRLHESSIEDSDEHHDDEQDADEQDAKSVALELALAQKYESKIVEGHAESCLWHKAGCKDDIYRLQVVRPTVWQPALRKRFTSVAENRQSIENVNIRQLESELGTLPSRRLLEDLPRGLVDCEQSSAELCEKILRVAMHGWRAASESGNKLLHCDACFQRIGLWMYQAEPRTSSTEPHGDETIEDTPVIDLIEMHREHCPWRNAVSQNAAGSFNGLNACQILQRVASTCARDYRRRTSEKSDAHAPVQELPDDSSAEAIPIAIPIASKEEIMRQDKERQSRLRKLKSLFSIKRRIPKPASTTGT